MSQGYNAEMLKCPYLRPETAERLAAFPLGVCCRLPHGRVRIPSRDELDRFRTTGHYADCVGFRRARYWETNVSGLA
jgi:hypothetical protein